MFTPMTVDSRYGLSSKKQALEFFILPLAFVLLLMQTSCTSPVVSLQPLYTGNDSVVEPRLEGTWEDPTDEEPWLWTFEKNDNESSYRLALHDRMQKFQAAFTVRLVRVDGALFLDAYPTPDEKELGGYSQSMLPVHIFLRAHLEGNRLRLELLNPEWMNKQLASRQAEVRYETLERDRLVLTASSAELQKLMANCGRTEGAFEEFSVLYRQGSGDYLDSLKEEVDKNPAEAAGNLARLGGAQMQQGGYLDALESFRRAVELEPQSAVYRLGHAEALFRLSRRDEALKELKEILQMPGVPKEAAARAHLFTGWAEFQRARFEDAEKEFHQGADITSDGELPADLWRTLALRRMGKHDEAQSLLENFANLPRSSFAKAAARFLQGGKSEQELLTEADSQRELSQAWFYIAHRALLDGNRQKARESFQKVAEIHHYASWEYAAARDWLEQQ